MIGLFTIISLCSFDHLQPFTNVYRSASSHENYCWMWETGERFFIVSPLVSEGTNLSIYAGSRGFQSDQNPDFVFTKNTSDTCVTYGKSVVSCSADIPANGSFFAAAVSIPLKRCTKGISFTTIKHSTWNASGDDTCIIIAPGRTFSLHLLSPLQHGFTIDLFTSSFHSPTFTFTNESTKYESVNSPAVLLSHGHGFYPSMVIESEGIGDLQTEAQGVVQQSNELVSAAIICITIAVIVISTIIVGSIRCFIMWSHGIVEYRALSAVG